MRIFLFDDKVVALYVTRKGEGNPWTAEQMKNRIVDRTDYPFVDDPAVHGKWVSVDFAETIEQFRPDQKRWGADLYLKEMTFLDDGKIALQWKSAKWTWTKGLIINEEGKTAPAYTIKRLDGKDYLFVEWKSGDYVFRHMTPQYYVLTRR